MTAGYDALCLMHIALWSQLGVLTRIYLAKFFTEGCEGGWGVCLLSEGLRLRTYGAYFADLASNMLGSYFMGALIASSLDGLPETKAVAALPLGHPWQGAPELFVGLRTGYCGSLTTFASWQYALVLSLIGGKGRQGGQWAEFIWGQVIGLQLSISSYAFGKHTADAVERWVWRTGHRVEAARSDVSADPGSGRDKQQRRQRLIRKTNAVGFGLLCVSTALWIALAVLDTAPAHAGRRQQWFAILVAPFGAALRWKLVALHGTVRGWRWFPAGTFAANILACCVDFGLGAALQRTSGLGYWVVLLFGAIRVGFSGALSTVSTFVAEIYKALEEWPNALHGYLYILITIGCGALSGIVIYGWSVWV